MVMNTAEDKCQNESVAQNVTGPFDIFHPQYDRQPGGCSYADERADRGDQRHQREGQRPAEMAEGLLLPDNTRSTMLAVPRRLPSTIGC